MNIGYATVSATDQELALQKDALTAAGCERMYEEKASDDRSDRLQLQDTLKYVREADVLAVWKRALAAVLRHLIEVFRGYSTPASASRSLTEAIDTTTNGGRLILHIFGAVGEFERKLDSRADQRRVESWRCPWAEGR